MKYYSSIILLIFSLKFSLLAAGFDEKSRNRTTPPLGTDEYPKTGFSK